MARPDGIVANLDGSLAPHPDVYWQTKRTFSNVVSSTIQPLNDFGSKSSNVVDNETIMDNSKLYQAWAQVFWSRCTIWSKDKFVGLKPGQSWVA